MRKLPVCRRCGHNHCALGVVDSDSGITIVEGQKLLRPPACSIRLGCIYMKSIGRFSENVPDKKVSRDSWCFCPEPDYAETSTEIDDFIREEFGERWVR